MLLCAALLAAPSAAFCQTADAETPPPEAAHASTNSVSPDQLKKGLNADTLSPEQIASAATEALRLQKDDAIEWDPQWGSFIELARKKGRLSDELWRDYLLGAVRFKIRVATSAKRGAGLPIEVMEENARTGGAEISASVTGKREDDLSGISIHRKGIPESQGMSLSRYAGSGMGWTEDLTQERFSALKPGPQTYHYRCAIQIFDGAGRKGKAATPLGERIVEGTIPWRLLAEDEAPPPPELRADPSVRAALVKSIHTLHPAGRQG